MTQEAPRSHLHHLLQAGEFVVTAELQTSDSANPARVVELAGTLRGKVDAVNCTDNSAAHAHIAAMAAARLLLEQGVEPVMQLVCRDRNRLALQADLLGAAALGVRNIVCMTGDDVSAGDHPETKPIYDLDSIHLLRILDIMRIEGTYLSGRELDEKPEFFMGCVENPFAPNDP
jgi:methylenetetrahydrofolate reductase (NADPH)